MSQGAPPAWRWQRFAEIASTQDVAIAAAASGDPGRLAVLAARQSAARGSRGRCWQSPAGNLCLSVLMRPSGPAEPGRWALLAGVALHHALAPHAARLMLKWPNDLLLDGAKLGGILIESAAGPAGELAWLVIGLGANLAQAPDGAARLPGPPPDPLAIAQAVLHHLDAYAAADTAAICAAWMARAHPVGTLLDVRTKLRRLTGAFAGLTPRGELRLAGQQETFSSAEIFLPRLLPCS